MKRSQIILSLLLVLSLLGNGYLLYSCSTLQEQYTNILGEVDMLKQAIVPMSERLEENKKLYEVELAKGKELENTIADLEAKLAEAEEQKKAAEIDNSVVARPDVPKPDGGTPEVEVNPDAPSSSEAEEKPSTSGIRTSGTVPGEFRDKCWNLRDGEAMTPAGKFIPINEIYDTCYYNRGGVLYMLRMGKEGIVKDPSGSAGTDLGGPSGETWG